MSCQVCMPSGSKLASIARVTAWTTRHRPAVWATVSADGEYACSRGNTTAAPSVRGRGETTPTACSFSAIRTSVSGAHPVHTTHASASGGRTYLIGVSTHVVGQGGAGGQQQAG